MSSAVLMREPQGLLELPCVPPVGSQGGNNLRPDVVWWSKRCCLFRDQGWRGVQKALRWSDVVELLEHVGVAVGIPR